MGVFDRFLGPPTKDKFADLLMAGIQRAGEKRQIAYDQNQFRLRLTDNAGMSMFLHNIYAEYCSVPKADRDKTLARCVKSWFVGDKTIPDNFQDASHDLLPSVRLRSYFGLAELTLRLEGRVPTEIPYQPLGDNLAIALVYDLPEAMRMIGKGELDEWGVTLYEAIEVACDNLRKMPCKFIGPQAGEGVYLSVTNDNYDACRLLLRDTIRQLRVKGDHIAMAPNRDTLIVTGSDDADGIKGMLALAKDALQKPRAMSGLAVRLSEDDEWVSWMPPVSHPCFDELRKLQIQNYAQHYEQQKEILDKLNQKDHEGAFVASFTAVQNTKTAAIWTYCVWSKGVLALLPRTDRVMFFEKEKKPLIADWDRVGEIVGYLMQTTEMYPERYRVVDYPTEEQLTVMRAKAIG